jgi:uncharacterized oxidoreductase
MKVIENTILITGGVTGIGFSLTEHFLNAGNKVIICGRRETKLKEAKEKFPNLHFKTCDVSNPDDRKSLFNWISSNFKDFNILINNAGIQKATDLKKGEEELKGEDEIDINLKAPIQLSALLIPLLLKKKKLLLSIYPQDWGSCQLLPCQYIVQRKQPSIHLAFQ